MVSDSTTSIPYQPDFVHVASSFSGKLRSKFSFSGGKRLWRPGAKPKRLRDALCRGASFQAKEHLEQLEVIFAHQFYPALTSDLKESETALANMRAAHEQAEQQWLQENQALVRDHENAEQLWLQEKQALVRDHENAEQLWLQEKRTLVRDHENAEQLWLQEKQALVRQHENAEHLWLQEKQDLVVGFEHEKEVLHAESRRMNRKHTALEEKYKSTRMLFSNLSKNHKNVKMQYDSLLRQQAVASGYKSIEAQKGLRRASEEDRVQAISKKPCLDTTEDKEMEEEEVWQEDAQNVSETFYQVHSNKVLEQVPDKQEPIMPPAAKEPEKLQLQKESENEKIHLTEPKRKGTLKDFFFSAVNEKWRTTRANTNANGRDPHDDFLSTPQELVFQKVGENMRNLDKPPEQHQVADEQEGNTVVPCTPAFVADSLTVECEKPVLNLAAKLPSHLGFVTAGRDKQPGLTGARSDANQVQGYKYNEPVRKKADREALQGVECKQCKKFYDAVLAEDAHAVMNTRCEHHEAVSRHRFRYIPPATPEGFWNIGFDSHL